MFGFIINRTLREDPLGPLTEKLAVLSSKAMIEGLDPEQLAKMSDDQGEQFGRWLVQAADYYFIEGMLTGILIAREAVDEEE